METGTREDHIRMIDGISADRIREKKMRLLENPVSVVIAPKTREGHLLTKILFGFDKVVNQIRLRAGSYIPIPEAASSLREAGEFIAGFEGLARSLGDGGYGSQWETEETRRMLAARRSTYVFLPRTEEGKRMALLLKRFDALLMQFKTTCLDFEKIGKTLADITDAISGFHNLTAKLATSARVEYRSPRGLSNYVKGEETKDVADGAENSRDDEEFRQARRQVDAVA